MNLWEYNLMRIIVYCLFLGHMACNSLFASGISEDFFNKLIQEGNLEIQQSKDRLRQEYPLHWASTVPNVDDMAKLLNTYRSACTLPEVIDSLDHEGRVPLQLAAETGVLEAVQLLVENGANVNPFSKVPWSPLTYAVDGGNIEVIEYLIDHEADLDAQKNMAYLELPIMPCTENVSPIMEALKANELDILSLLIKKGANVNLPNSFFLHFTVKYNMLEAAKILLDNGIDINQEDYAGRTALFIAHEYGSRDNMVKLLQSY
jgi:ankyrin repeat protein